MSVANESSEPAPKKFSIFSATGLLLLLLLIAAGIGIYMSLVWSEHNGRLAEIKKRGGDYRQLTYLEDLDPEKKQTFQEYIKQFFPGPVQMVYWINDDLTEDDKKLIARFPDVEMLSVQTKAVDGKTIETFLALPKLTKIRVQASSIDLDNIASWKINDDMETLIFVNPTWERKDLRDVQDKADANKALDGKVQFTNQTGPSFGG